jgi:N-acetyl-gamma-glutamyl-phosphate reductase common form
VKVRVVGGAGYVAGELLRILISHPAVVELRAFSRSGAGRAAGDVHPALAGRTALAFEAATPAEAARGADVVFLALEHGESSRVMREVLDAAPGRVIDLAADFRVHDPALHERYYGAHRDPELAPTFTYALADVLGTELAGCRRLAVPGCFATAAALALRPLARLGAAPVAFAVTGSSGAGARLCATAHHPARAHNLFAYSSLAHRHEAEILEQWRRWTGAGDAAVRLLAHAGPFVRGIYLTLHARLAEPADVPALFRRAYGARPFVRLVDGPPELTHAAGTNTALIHVAATADRREIAVHVAIDNLIKGAAGQAVQAMNLSLGLDERAGLDGAAIFPC